MENLITVMSLQGQAWAVSQDGTRRELKVGDTVAADEMVVTADGARIDVQFANNQVLSLIGEQEMPAQALQDAQATPLSTPLTPINTPVTTSTPASQGSHALKEGHNFVQLVRIAEIIEADGFTPLSVARIQEIIKPLGMVLPERDFEDDRWKDNYSRNDSGHRSVDRTPPELQGGELEALKNLDADMINLDLSSRFKDAVSGSDITYVAENLPKGLTINPKTGVISGKIDSSASQGGNTGTKGDYKVTITVTDPAGNSSEHDFVWTVTNPPPVATDDTQTIDEDTVATGNVISGTNASGTGGGPDNDPDGDELKVTGFTVGGNTYQPGQTATIAEGGVTVGTVTIDEHGNYTFTPEKDWSGTVPDIGYTITDGEGGEDEAKLTITVTPVNDPPVAIGSAPPNQTSEDADIIGSTEVVLDLPHLFDDVDGDTLTYTIDGLPAGLAFDPVTGVISGTIDRSASQSGDNGVHTVTIIATDPDGETAEHTFTWTVTNPEPAADDDTGTTLKSVRLEVPAAGGVLENDTDPDGDPLTVQGVVPGAGVAESEAGVGAGITGQYGTLILQADGSYTYLPDLTNDRVWQLGEHDAPLTDTFTYTVSDCEGGTDTAKLTITINGQSHTPPVITPQDKNGAAVGGHITVYEKGLKDGTSDQDEHIAAGDIDISALDGLKSITLGDQTFTLEQLLELSPGHLLFEDADGKLIFTGFEPFPEVFVGSVPKVVAGKLSYTYELKLEQEHPDGAGENEFQINIPLKVTDDQDAPSVGGTLVINVVDDVPEAHDDVNEITEDATAPAEGNVIDNDDEGADGATVTAITSENVTDSLATDDGSGVLTIEGQYGTLTIHPNGGYTYVLDNSNLDVQGLHPDDDPLKEVFTYTLTDGDEDSDTATLTININGSDDGVTVTVPNPGDPNDPDNPPDTDAYPENPADSDTADLVVFESGLPTGSSNDNGEAVDGLVKVESNFTISALDGLDELTIGGATFSKEELEGFSTTSPSTVIYTDYGQLILTGYELIDDPADPAHGTITIDYEYTLTSAPDNNDTGHTDEHAFDHITITAKDRDGDDDEQTLTIKIIDDAPVAKDDKNSVTEGAGIDDTSSVARGNVLGRTGGVTEPSDDDVADTAGADGAAVTEIVSNNVAGNDATADAGGALTIDGQYGTLTIHPDGSYTYELDNSNLEVQGLTEGETFDEVFTYTLTDGDGDQDDATLTITINGQDDDVTITVPDPTDPDDPNYPVVDDPQDPDDPARGVVDDLVVFESGLNDGSHPDNDDIKVESSFTLSALDGLDEDEALIVGGESFTKDQIEALDNSNPSTHQTVTTTYGELVLTGYELNDDGTITISYEYTLTSAPDNSDADHTDDHAFDRISITATDRDGDDNTQTLSIKIIDDAPVAENQTEVELAEGEETVGYIDDGDGNNTLTGDGENLLANDTQGADGARLYQIRYGDDDNVIALQDESGTTVTDADGNVTIPEGDSVTVITPEGGTLTVHSNGDWQYTSPPAGTGSDDTSADHGTGDGENLPDGFQYNLIDGDDDISDWATQPINVTDTVPGVGDGTGGTTAPENATVDEAHLPTGTDPDNDELIVGGGLGVIKSADGIETTFDGDLSYLEDLGLTSNGNDLSYEIDEDTGQLVAIAVDKEGKKVSDVFTVTIIEGYSENAHYEFTLQGPLDHYGDNVKVDSDGNSIIDIPFEFIVTDADGDTAKGEFTVTVTDDPPPPTGGTAEITFDEEETGTLTTPANAGGANGAEISIPNNGNSDPDVTGAPQFGTVTIDPLTGNLTYTPNDEENFSGHDSFTYTYTPPGSKTPITTTVNVTVNPVADAPELPHDDYDSATGMVELQTDEDEPKALGLKLPEVTDAEAAENVDHDADHDFDYPERLGAISLGAEYGDGESIFVPPAGYDPTDPTGDYPGVATLFYLDENDDRVELTPNLNGEFQIVITDGPDDYHIDGLPAHDPANGVYRLTTEQYKALQIQPAEHAHENFTVNVSVTSYEVDEGGAPLKDDDGNVLTEATSTQEIEVDVLAVTDKVTLEFKGDITITPDVDGDDDSLGGIKHVEVKTDDNDDFPSATGFGDLAVWINEDHSFNLSELLNASFDDLDGSESRWLTINDLKEGTRIELPTGAPIIVGESGSITIPAGRLGAFGNGTSTDLPEITLTPPEDFSGDMTGITITLHGQDTDGDSYEDGNPIKGEEFKSDVTLDLYVYPQGGDIEENVDPEKGVEDDEDPIAFLQNVKVEQNEDNTVSNERITEVSFELPDGWVHDGSGDESNWRIETPSTGEASDWTVTVAGTTYTITAVGNYDLAKILGDFTVTPPEHSSKTQDLELTIKTEDTDTVAGDEDVSRENEVTRELTIEVRPVAEVIPESEEGEPWIGEKDVDDLTMTEGHYYKATGAEGEPFTLGTDGAFDLGERWANSDGRTSYGQHESGDGSGSEDTYALLTPELLSGASAIGSKFSWTENGTPKEAIFNGQPVEVPYQYLDSLTFTAVSDGLFRIKVQALTKDYGDDASPLATPVENTSGEAYLQNIVIEPRAGVVSADVGRRITEYKETAPDGNREGGPIPLSITPRSSRADDTFKVSVMAVPADATIHYNGEIITADTTDMDGVTIIVAGDGSWTVAIDDFDTAGGLGITPPAMDNSAIKLEVEIESKGTLWLTKDGTKDGEPLDLGDAWEKPTGTLGNWVYDDEVNAWRVEHTHSTPFESDITVVPQGVADGVEIEWGDGISWDDENKVATGYEVSELGAEVDGIALGALFSSITAVDTVGDGSTLEDISYKISGLPAGVTLTGGTSIGGGAWTLTWNQLQSAKLNVPDNFKGELKLTLSTTTTERKDGDYKEQEWPISILVTPSPEAEMTLATSIKEDEREQLSFRIQHRNNDTDEELTAVWINPNSIHPDITLYYGDTETVLNSNLEGVEAGSGDMDGWIKLTGSAINNVYAQGSANLHTDGAVDAFEVGYEITDKVTVGGIDHAETTVTNGTYQITVTPVTDQVTIAVNDGTGFHELDDPGSITIGLTVGNTDGDYDGSETLTRIILEGVPEGVTLTGVTGLPTGAGYSLDMVGGIDVDGRSTNTWIVRLDNDARFTGEMDIGLNLDVSWYASNLDHHPIKITVESEDAGNGVPKRASTEELDITLTTTFDGEGDVPDPAKVIHWEQNPNFEPDEDGGDDGYFTLADVMSNPDATLPKLEFPDENVPAGHGFTITLTDLPLDTQIVGMHQTTIGVTPVWTVSGTGGNAELEALLETIRIFLPEDWNTPGAGEGSTFDYTASLSTHVPNGRTTEDNYKSADIELTVNPVTDNASIGIDAPSVSEGETIKIGITVDNTADSPNWTLVGGKIYVQLDTSEMGAGALTYNETELEPESDPDGLSGVYYVITVPEGWEPGDDLDLEFTPDDKHARGELGIHVTVVGQEEGSIEVTTSMADAAVAIVSPQNDGYTFELMDDEGDPTNSVTGKENDGSGFAVNAIQLPIKDEGLVDQDNEEVQTLLLSGVPQGFLVYAGNTVDDADLALATNIAGAWQIPLTGDGKLPGYISILPPQHWSGTLSDLGLTIISGEISGEVAPLAEDTVWFGLEVKAVANGITLAPNDSFGTEGKPIAFNFNADFIDGTSAGFGDESSETATLEIKGLGEHAAFYIGDALIDMASKVVYSDGVYTISGLTQSDLGKLSFVQAANDTAGKLEVRAQTVECANPEAPSKWSEWANITTHITEQLATTDADTLIWTGESINGHAGEDTIQLRFGESVSGTELKDNLDNIEVISMVGNGANSITSLSVEDVFNMTDERNVLRILGDEEDSVVLTGWGTGTVTGDYTVYTANHNQQEVKLEVSAIIIE